MKSPDDALERSGRYALAALVVVALVAAVAATAFASSTVSARSGPLHATLTISTRNPVINEAIPIRVTATLNSAPAKASVVYQFVFNGAVVGTQYPDGHRNFSFTGSYRDTLRFPAEAVGFPLILRVLVRSAGRTAALNCAITAHR